MRELEQEVPELTPSLPVLPTGCIRPRDSPLLCLHEPASGVSVQDEEEKFTGWAVVVASKMAPTDLRPPGIPLCSPLPYCSRADLCNQLKYSRNDEMSFVGWVMKRHHSLGFSCCGMKLPKMALGSLPPPGIHALVYNPFLERRLDQVTQI